MIDRLATHEDHPGSTLESEGRAGPLGQLRAALAMLTRLPVGAAPAAETGAAAFGIVGAVVGVAGFLPLVTLGAAVPSASAILAIAAMALLSGAIHLDGLADTADALVSVGPDAAERARKDPAVGVGGVVALVLVIGVEVASLAALVVGSGPLVAALACLAAAAVSRVAPVVLVRLAGSHTAASGLGAWFAARTTNAAAVIALVTAIAVAVMVSVAIGELTMFAAVLIGGCCGLVVGLRLVGARGQLDGDLLGATVELTFAATVLACAVLASWAGP
jgi:adenosylcobinamide-GDP ribazoletransferase